MGGCTDVHVQWEDVPGAPLGAFLTEQAFMEAFSRYGVVVAVRIPRRASTREPQCFGFVSYLYQEDAVRLSRRESVEVAITPTWKLELRPKLAKFGNLSDKRVAVKANMAETGEFGGYDYIHLMKR